MLYTLLNMCVYDISTYVDATSFTVLTDIILKSLYYITFKNNERDIGCMASIVLIKKTCKEVAI